MSTDLYVRAHEELLYILYIEKTQYLQRVWNFEFMFVRGLLFLSNSSCLHLHARISFHAHGVTISLCFSLNPTQPRIYKIHHSYNFSDSEHVYCISGFQLITRFSPSEDSGKELHLITCV